MIRRLLARYFDSLGLWFDDIPPKDAIKALVLSADDSPDMAKRGLRVIHATAERDEDVKGCVHVWSTADDLALEAMEPNPKIAEFRKVKR